jgi:hypothetical protein
MTSILRLGCWRFSPLASSLNFNRLARPSSMPMSDIYTDVPLLGTAVIKGNGLKLIRGDGICEALQRPVFRGRGTLSQVWKVKAPKDAPTAADRRN